MIKFPKNLLDEIKTHLTQELGNVNTQIEELKSQDPFSDTSRVNDNAASDTEANEEIDHERFQALIKELSAKKHGLEASLSRVGDGTYGHCTNCQSLIDTDRLAAIPTATLCMNCEALKKK